MSKSQQNVPIVSKFEIPLFFLSTSSLRHRVFFRSTSSSSHHRARTASPSNFRLRSEQAVATLVMQPEPRIQDNTARKDRLLRHKESPSYDKQAVLIVAHRRSHLFLCRFDRAVSVSAPLFVHFLIGVTVIPYGNYVVEPAGLLQKCPRVSKTFQQLAKRSKSEQKCPRVSKTFQQLAITRFERAEPKLNGYRASLTESVESAYPTGAI